MESVKAIPIYKENTTHIVNLEIQPTRKPKAKKTKEEKIPEPIVIVSEVSKPAAIELSQQEIDDGWNVAKKK